MTQNSDDREPIAEAAESLGMSALDRLREMSPLDVQPIPEIPTEPQHHIPFSLWELRIIRSFMVRGNFYGRTRPPLPGQQDAIDKIDIAITDQFGHMPSARDCYRAGCDECGDTPQFSVVTGSCTGTVRGNVERSDHLISDLDRLRAFERVLTGGSPRSTSTSHDPEF